MAFTKKLLYVALMPLMLACSNPTATVPAQYTDSKAAPIIYPDYNGVTVPCNIAPPNFAIEQLADDYVTRITAEGREWVYGSDAVEIPFEDWDEMKQAALASKGEKPLTIEVFTEQAGKWTRQQPFSIFVSPDSIDPYISYRLIAPSYVTYEDLTINQRCLENYEETLIYSNMINGTEKDGQCINCHAYQNYDPNRMQFHVRQYKGGTVIAYDGDIKKMNLKTESTISAGVYPAWHPTLPLIAYSTNNTGQSFHTYDKQKIEVQDTYSDLILYDVEKQLVEPLEKDTNDLDCFPFWDPKGEYLYYCSAHYEQIPDTIHTEVAPTKEMNLILNYKKVHYNLYRRPFDATTHKFGARELIYDCADTASATLPRISPDGRYLLFTRGEFGVFHIWHNTADLYMIDLQAPENKAIEATLLQGAPQIQTSATEAVAAKTDGTTGATKQADGTTGATKQTDGKTGATQQAAKAVNIPRTPTYSRNMVARCVAELNSPDVESYHSWSSNGKWVILSSRRYDGNFTRPFIAHLNADGTFSRPFELPQRDPRYHLNFMRSYNIPEFMRGPVTIRPQDFADIIAGDSIQAASK